MNAGRFGATQAALEVAPLPEDLPELSEALPEDLPADSLEDFDASFLPPSPPPVPADSEPPPLDFGGPLSPARLRLPSFLKSVSYHPPPFSRNPAAETSLVNDSLPHSGQWVSGASLIFCSFSSLWLHSRHSYS